MKKILSIFLIASLMMSFAMPKTAAEYENIAEGATVTLLGFHPAAADTADRIVDGVYGTDEANWSCSGNWNAKHAAFANRYNADGEMITLASYKEPPYAEGYPYYSLIILELKTAADAKAFRMIATDPDMGAGKFRLQEFDILVSTTGEAGTWKVAHEARETRSNGSWVYVDEGEDLVYPYWVYEADLGSNANTGFVALGITMLCNHDDLSIGQYVNLLELEVLSAATEVPETESPETEPAETEPTETETPVTDQDKEPIEDVFEYILSRYAYLEFGNGKYADQAYQSEILKKINTDCKTWMDLVDRDCTTDPFGKNYAFTSANMSGIYKNILCMARGYATPGSDYYKNEKLLDDIIFCLDFMYDKYYGETKNKLPSGSNWHDSYINSPGSLTRILLALRDELTVDEMKHYTDRMDSLIYSPAYTSANMIDMTFSIILASALQRDGNRLQKAVDTLSANVFDYVESGDGIYEDGSYIMHESIPYTTGYGGSLLDMLSMIMYTVAGSEYAFSDELINRQVDWIFDSFVPVLFRGAAMSAVSGRIIWSNPNESFRSVCIITGLARISQYAPEDRAKEIKALLKYYLAENAYAYETSGLISTADFILEIQNDESIVSAGDRFAAKVFPHMARVTTHRGAFASMLSMCSPKIARYEGFVWSPTNLENCNAWYTGAGMLYVYADSNAQFDSQYHHYANHYRLPGTTVDTRPREPENNKATFNRSAFVGGAQMDEYAMAAFQYDNQNGDFSSDLVAKKAYFFFDNEYVMLGADINSTRDKGVITTVENQKMLSNAMKLYLNDDEKNVTAEKETKMEGVKYAYISKYGSIVFPEKQNVTVNIAANSGAKFIEIFFDHGTKPKDETYSYIILPLASREEGKAYYAQPDVEILSNTKKVQAVHERNLGLTGIVFWESVEFNGIHPDFACTMLVKETENGIQIGVSDPTMNIRGDRTITLDGIYTLSGDHEGISISSDGNKTIVKVNMTGSDGQTIHISLNRE